MRFPDFRSFRARAVALGLLCATTLVQADTDPAAQMLLGNPDSAKPRASSREHFLLSRPQYALSYNDRLRFPNWVSWHLSAGDIGRTSRGQFQPDTKLPDEFTVVYPRDYTGSGYDRGHNCPSADRSASREDNDALFFMTNITPQAHGMNAGPWEGLESYCRDLAKGGNELYILCGHGFSSSTVQKLGRAGVAVPDFGWKIVLVLPDKAGDDLKRITAETRVIAVRMPNINTVSQEDWTQYIVTPEEIEQATKLQMFTALPAEVAAALRLKRDAGSGGRSSVTRTDSDPQAEKDAATAGEVWVNLNSGKYWYPGTRYYGKTSKGKYMTEKDAKAAGYVAAKGQQ